MEVAACDIGELERRFGGLYCMLGDGVGDLELL